MFDNLIERIAQSPKQALFLAAGVVVIVAQLVSMAMLAQGEVRKAHARETVRESTRLALMDCLENNPSTTLSACAARASMQVAGTQDGRFDDGYASAAAAVGTVRASIGSSIVPVTYAAR
jgi:hypothetical protein